LSGSSFEIGPPLCDLCDLLFKYVFASSGLESVSERNAEFYVLNSVQRLRLPLLIFVVVVVSLLFGGGIALYSFVHGDACRQWLTRRLNHSLRVDGKLEPIIWSGMTFSSSGYSGPGQAKSRINSLDASGISAHLNWPSLLARTWDLDQVSVDRANVYVGKPIASQGEQKHASSSSGINLPHFFAFDFQIDHITVNQGNLHWSAGQNQAGELLGTKIVASRRGEDSWDVSASGGKGHHAGLPPVTLDSLSASTGSKGITITQARLFGEGGGTISLNGFVALDANQISRIHTEFSGVSINDFYPETLHLNGIASGNADYAGTIQREDAGAITGSLHIDKLRMDWSVFLGKVGSFIKISGMDDWSLDSVDTQVIYRDQHIEFSHLVAKFQDQAKIEGNGTIDSGQINATFSVGLSAAILKWLPGVQQKVFTEERDGLYWAPVQLTGTPQNPKEDLSKRISSALQESVGKELKDQAKDALKSFLDLLKH
jgi:hypothetical protein